MAKMALPRRSKPEQAGAELHEPDKVPPEVATVHRVIHRLAKSDNPGVRKKLAKMLKEVRETGKPG